MKCEGATLRHFPVNHTGRKERVVYAMERRY